MPILGTKERPLRVAIIGAGPAGFYASEALLKENLNVKVDMFEKLPAPFGLVRYGVAPDHEKIKNVIKMFEKTAGHPQFSFFGNVSIGDNITVLELQKFYDAAIFCYGAAADRRLGIKGEDLDNSYTATEFVGWYNGHPDFQDVYFDFLCEKAVIMGQGNVAMNVARILCTTPDELKKTDICQHALEILAESKIKEIHIYGRRGPVQAAFSAPEIREMGDLAGCYPVVDPKDLELNEASLKELDGPANASRKKKFEVLRHFTTIRPDHRKRKFELHFKRSPVEISGNGHVEKVRFEINDLTGEPGHQIARGTGQFEEIECGIFFSSVGYTGIPLNGLPFSSQKGVIPSQAGRVMDGQRILPGWYVSGWIKHGANGLIGANRACAEETVQSLLADLGRLKPCAIPNTGEVAKFLEGRAIKLVTFIDWKKIDVAEIKRGVILGKPREKFIRIKDMLSNI